MARRILLVALALSMTGLALRAQQRATFILTDGQRVSGMLDTREMGGSELSLVMNRAQGAQTFSFDQVAVIDFAGGWPRANELNALRDGGHMMAMRNGGTRFGYLVTMMNGDTVVWQEEGGARRDIPVRQVARIYLNPDAARETYNAGPGGYGAERRAPWAPAYGQGGAREQVTRNIRVPGNRPWTDSGIEVVRGEVLRFDDQGGITFIEGPENTANAGGKNEFKSDKYPVPSAGVGALIGKVGTNGTPFMIGAGANPVTMPATGRLWLGINDDNFGDNSGAYQVAIIRR